MPLDGNTGIAQMECGQLKSRFIPRSGQERHGIPNIMASYSMFMCLYQSLEMGKLTLGRKLFGVA
jgi:hypothetical protein